MSRHAVHAAIIALVITATMAGCQSAQPDPLSSLQRYDFTDARDVVRPLARRRPMHENSILAYAELGLASLAAGDLQESIQALTEAYEFIETGQLNDDARILAATILQDGLIIWKGEPFEQASMLLSLGAANALIGDWDNARVAGRAAVRRLEEYADARSRKETGHSLDEYFLDDFAAGYLLQGLAQQIRGSVPVALDLADRADPSLGPMTDRIRSGQFNTVLFVDYGRGPIKERYGSDGQFTRWTPREYVADSVLQVIQSGSIMVESQPTLNLNAMASSHRWVTLQGSRTARSALGTGSMIGGVVVANSSNRTESQLIGLGMILGGLILRSSAQADLRQNLLVPAAMYIVPLDLPDSGGSLELVVRGDSSTRTIVTDVVPGSNRDPQVIYVRLFFQQQPPYFLTSQTLEYTNDFALPEVGDYPWIFGGTCVATPTDQVMQVYHAGGYLLGWTADDLKQAYSSEGILIGSGPVDDTHGTNNDYRHVLLGGRALYTPHHGTLGYKRLMQQSHPPYQPKTDRVRAMSQHMTSSLYSQLHTTELQELP